MTRLGKLPSGDSLNYELSGPDRDTPILLIRPLGGSMALWGSFRAHLAEHHRVVAFDLPGTGGSTRGTGLTSTRKLALDAIQLLDHLAIDRAHVFGISLGGMIATSLAILEPKRVEKLCIASAPARGIDLLREGPRSAMRRAACMASGEPELCLVRGILSPAFRTRHPDQVLEIETILRRQPTARRDLFHLALAGLRHDATAELPKIQAATLVLVGRDDMMLVPGSARALAEAIPRARFRVIPDSGHALTLEQPRVSAECVAEFFFSDLSAE